MSKLNEDLFAESQGACQPQSGQTVTGGVYDELFVAASVSNVTFGDPIFMADVTIRGRGHTGTIYVPKTTTTINLGGNNVTVVKETLRQLKQRAGPDQSPLI